MRKVLCILLIAVMALTVVACGSDAPQQPDQAPISQAQNLNDLAGRKIAAQAGTFHLDALDQIANVQASSYPEFADLLIALKSKAIEGYVAEEPTALSVCGSDNTLSYVKLVNNSTGFKADESDTGIAVGLKKGSALTAQMNDALTALNTDVQRELMTQIIAITNGQSVSEFALKSEVPTNPVGTLKVGMECAYEPYNWTETSATSYGCVPIYGEGKDGLYANGYDVQVAQYIANKLNMKLEVYAIEWDSLIPALQSGAVDAIIAGMSPTAERATQIDFTNCYYNSNLVIVIRKED